MPVVAHRARPFLALFALALVAFWPLVFHPTETLYSDTSDLLAEHLPAKLFLVRSLRETGELPLWNPEQYAGSPFVHDIQVGLFYPPHLPLYVISEPAVGPFLSWLVFGHVVLAGWLMYAYGRHAGLAELGAFVAAVGFMLAPRWLMQLFLAGHTVTVGIAWLPLVMLCVERAIQRRSQKWALGGGVAYALLILGTHPQWTFYASLLIGLWPLRLLVRNGEPGRVSAGSASTRQDLPALTQPGSPLPSRTLIARWLVVELAVVLVGVALCAVQLLPTLEAAGESSRARGMARSWSLPGGLLAATTLIGPFPDRVAGPVHWEARGAIGFTWAVLAMAAWWIGGRAARVPALIALGLLAFALGGSVLFDRLPGFNSFRMPTRMLLTLTFPIAFLAGLTVQSLAAGWPVRPLIRASLLVLAVAAGPGLIALLSNQLHPLGDTRIGWWVYWLVMPPAWAVFVWRGDRLSARHRPWACVGLLVLDVLILSVPYPDTRPMAELYPNPAPDFHPGPRSSRVYDPEFPDGGCWLGPGSPTASAHGVHSIRGFNPLDVARYRQFLAFIADVGEPQKAFSGDFTHPVTVRFPIKNRPLFDLLGVAFVATSPDDPPPGPGWFRLPPQVNEPRRSYNFLGPGLQDLPPIALYGNLHTLDPAFIVPNAVREAPDADVLGQLKGLGDLQLMATLADWDPAADPVPRSDKPAGRPHLLTYSPNEVVLALDGRSAGVLVLTDPWYPGWECSVDGVPIRIWKADYGFRGVMVPAGTQQVVFRFEPRSYRLGRTVSVGTAAMLAGLLFGALARHLWSRNRTN